MDGVSPVHPSPLNPETQGHLSSSPKTLYFVICMIAIIMLGTATMFLLTSQQAKSLAPVVVPQEAREEVMGISTRIPFLQQVVDFLK